MRLTKLLLLLTSVVLVVSIVAVKCEQDEDDFAEFDDDFEEDELSRARSRKERTPAPKGKFNYFNSREIANFFKLISNTCIITPFVVLSI